MKKNIIVLSTLFYSGLAFSQVGINTPDPKANLDVIGTAAGTTLGIRNTASWDNLWFNATSRDSSINASGAEDGLHFNMGTNTTGTYGDGQTLTTVATLRQNGNFGIGTTAPQNRLDLGTSNGATSLTAVVGKKLALYNNPTTGNDFYGLGINTGYLQFHAGSTTTAAPGMVLHTSGNIGIGTTTNAPGQRLTVVDAGNTNSLNGIASFLAQNLTQGVGIGWNGIQGIGTAANVNLNLNGKGTGNIIIQGGAASTGNVGIGTAPQTTAKLDVTGNILGLKRTAAGPWDNLWLDVTDTSIPTINASGAETGLQIRVGSNATGAYGNGQTLNPVATFRPNGNVGIGTQTPNDRVILQLESTTKGFLPPRMTTAERDALAGRPAGTIIYNNSTNCMQYWSGTAWRDNCTVAGTITGLNCATATLNRTYSDGAAVTIGATAVISYTGGNGGTYAAQAIASTGVTGLTVTLTAGSFANGGGNLTYTISGTPTAPASGTTTRANFTINIGGRSCTLVINVAPTTLTCQRIGFSGPGGGRYVFGDAGATTYSECFRVNGQVYIYSNGYSCPASSAYRGGIISSASGVSPCVVQ